MEQGARMGFLADYAAVLRNRNFTLLWSGQTISWFGDSLYFIALLWLVQELTESRAMLGIVAAARTLPSLLGFLAGALVDRWDRRKIMITSDVVRAVIVAVVPLLWWFELLEPWQLPVVAACLGGVAIFFVPARQALMPELVQEPELVQANAMMTFSLQLTTATGFAVGGIILGYIGIEWLFVFDSITFLASALALLLMRLQSKHVGAVDTAEAAAGRTRLIDEVRAGFRFIGSSPVLVRLLPLVVAMNFVIVPLFVLLPSWVKDVLGAGPKVFGFLETSRMVGLVAGSLLVAPLIRWTRRSTFVFVALLLQSFGLIAFAWTRTVPLAMAGLFAFGLLDSLVVVTLTAYFQSIIPRSMRGRVFGAFETVSQALVPVGQALGGFVGQLMSLPVLYGMIGWLRTLGSVVAWALPGFRQSLETGSVLFMGEETKGAVAGANDSGCADPDLLPAAATSDGNKLSTQESLEGV